MKSIKDFIFYYRSCPLCGSWVTLDADTTLPNTMEIQDDRLILTIIERDKSSRKYSILFSNNKVEADYPFVLSDLRSTIKRLYYNNYSESFKIEARCHGCRNFRYWSKTMIYNEKTKKLNNIDVSGERVQFHELTGTKEKVSYIISNNYSTKETEVFVVRATIKGKALKIKMPFMPFKKINFNHKDDILDRIKKILILA